MLERNDGRVPRRRARRASKRCAPSASRPTRRGATSSPPTTRVHRAIVDAAESPRISRAYAALAGEMHLFVVQLKPSWTLLRMAEHHERLLDELEAEGPPALRRHLRDGAQSVLDS